MKKLVFFMVLVLLVKLTFLAQQTQSWIKGDLLIQLTENTDPINLEKEFEAISLSNGKLISKHMNIWKYTYNHHKFNIEEAIDKIYASKIVVTVQRNHKIKHRAVPNDADYSSQWQYSQTNDKDIDADLAWEVTTGGLTPLGDTIVVCVIDDGIQLTHPDLIPNLWINYNEIPNNNIDDDGNGYIDDVKGWNSYNNDDDVAHSSWGGHGSAVAGIVGAKGNNNIGVAGVNWDVKMMIVNGGGNEAEAIAAYSYALENRKLYNTTNGAKGAFVVATNASWGVDGGQAADAPLWCSMYDTLGNYGVLNTGATVNGNVNVDVDGDLPTQCPSEFLITVTNTNQSDNKQTQAGYGLTTIDLGAPGAGTWTVDGSNGLSYGSFGGTSGATPHVAGTIGLLYSIPCNYFANIAKNNPKEAAAQIRNFILYGVEPNVSLDGITTTGGRLNVNNAVQNLVYACNTVSLEEQNTFSKVSIFPNPITDDFLNLAFSSKVDTKSSLTVLDLAGKKVHFEELQLIKGENKIKINLPELAKGMYHLNLNSDFGSMSLKFLK
jgi:hypothetical protein